MALSEGDRSRRKGRAQLVAAQHISCKARLLLGSGLLGLVLDAGARRAAPEPRRGRGQPPPGLCGRRWPPCSSEQWAVFCSPSGVSEWPARLPCAGRGTVGPGGPVQPGSWERGQPLPALPHRASTWEGFGCRGKCGPGAFKSPGQAGKEFQFQSGF